MLPIASAPIKRESENKFPGYATFYKVAEYFDDAVTQRGRRLLVGKAGTEYAGYAFCDTEMLKDGAARLKCKNRQTSAGVTCC